MGGQKTHWDRAVVRVWSTILIVAGVLILALELKPRPGHPAEAALRRQGHDAAMTRGGLAGALRAAALDIDGISRLPFRVRRRRARITATVGGPRPGRRRHPPEPVTEAARRRLDDLQLRHPPRLRVRVIPRSR